MRERQVSEAAITDHLRTGTNALFVDPGTSGYNDATLIGAQARLAYRGSFGSWQFCWIGWRKT